jgi:hypothetical protein
MSRFRIYLTHWILILLALMMEVGRAQELLSKLFRVFLSPHPNSGVILTHAWHSQSIQIKPILILRFLPAFRYNRKENEGWGEVDFQKVP